MKFKGICVTQDKFPKKSNFKYSKTKRGRKKQAIFLKVLFCTAINAQELHQSHGILIKCSESILPLAWKQEWCISAQSAIFKENSSRLRVQVV